jgi:hypothetical protein
MMTDECRDPIMTPFAIGQMLLY